MPICHIVLKELPYGKFPANEKTLAVGGTTARAGVPWHRSEMDNQVAPVHRLKLCREAPTSVIDPETTTYRLYAPTQEGGQLCFPAKP